VPTDTSPTWSRDARSFALRAVAWSLALFGLLRWPWIQAHALLPVTQAQARVATGLFGTSSLPVDVTLACSGADAIALCLAAVFAYPASWRMRLTGGGAGLALILGLNVVRIGTLGRAAASPPWFDALHVYVWPAALLLAIAGYVFGWMHLADRRDNRQEGASALPGTTDEPRRPLPLTSRATRRFIVLSATFLVLFTAASPLYLESARVLAVAAFIARAAAATLRLIGIQASAAANVVQTPSGGLLVTQECISTPLIPIYVAAVLAYAGSWRRIVLGLLATTPLFVGLGIARLLVVALPATLVASPLFVIHAFYQLVLAAVIVFVTAVWRHGAAGRAAGPAVAGIIAGVAGAWAFSHLPVSSWASATGGPLDDPQGALAFLPAFQAGLYIALWIAAFVGAGWKRFLAGFAFLVLTQIGLFIGLQALAAWPDLTPHVRDVRGWAVVGPVLVIIAAVNLRRRLHGPAGRIDTGGVRARDARLPAGIQ
jgi:exosortase/archaeosortase family protein